ncbi:hypothetical protein ACFFON_06100 [Arthrobacter citreus]|uniref:hypothetical protein n=1 Tax=Arthrobacter TaxID=1663 RepID=UPI001264024C|nr:hypothetical protein [Arthrobacter gandavensis]
MAKLGGDPTNQFLAVLGVICIAVAGAGFLLERSEALTGGFLICGIFLCVAGVLAPRMEGGQKLGLTGAEFNLSKLPEIIKEAEIEVKTERLTEIEDVI